MDESFRSKIFTVVDPDARLRDPADLMQFLPLPAGGRATIPVGTRIRVDEVARVEKGANRVALFANTVAVDGGQRLGWTSVVNFEGRFLSETLRRIEPPAGGGHYSNHAVWIGGTYRGQVALIEVLGTGDGIKVIAANTAGAFIELVAAARNDQVAIGLVSGFRSWAHQKQLHEGYRRGLPGYNLAAEAGRSNHQNGVAFDLDVGNGGSNRTYLWLQQHATRHGFVATVRSEPWHWEHKPDRAAAALAQGRFWTW